MSAPSNVVIDAWTVRDQGVVNAEYLTLIYQTNQS